ncbi:zinc finger CCCH domain-containing protein 32-like isoform X2 [Dioscorea cayenensis subsp. rotundata]|uniref:Zinc finger CCCH domain-containing protein 32-like isoform X2 n=1 Tax=Dioscorea cayennensis subsp. rotundata TaxID=55577 RepID=A0AB40B538_DIOCR|nr:zinc finger CCCH domain-containing protein 32-like isoform X2 [Dioscorea cayenensis subsp. rotundata]
MLCGVFEVDVKKSRSCYSLSDQCSCLYLGMECEFRHSDVARLNPRGCRYWLSGNCLNLKCPFRHPPLLDGPPSPVPQVAAPVQALALQTSAYNSNKQSVPCYYFQKGHCLKADRCPFMHWAQPTGNPPSQLSTKASTTSTDSSQKIKDSWAVKECTSQSNTSKINVDRPVELSSSSANLVLKPEATANGQAMARNFPHHPSADIIPRPQVTKFPNRQPENVHPRSRVSKFTIHPSDNVHPTAQPTKVLVGSSVDRSRPRNFHSHPATEQLKKSGESTQFLEKSSPAFNFLGENNAEDSGHFDNNDDHVRKLVQGRRKLDHVDGFSYQHRDHKPAMEFDGDQLKRMREYTQHERQSDTCGRDQQNSSERIVDQTYTNDRRVLQRKDGAEEMDSSDLRHRLLKQRKLNSSRTAVCADYRGEPHQRNDHYAEEGYRQHNLQGDLPDYHLQSSISNRLRGRITNPMRSSPDRSIDVRPERERERRQLQSRLSPVRPLSHQGRHHDGTKRKLDEISALDGRSFGDKSVRIEAADPLDFAGPKSLAELKGAKVSEGAQGRQPLKRTNASASREHKDRNLEKLAGHQEPEASLSFEGPKPLSTILKRKRETASENGASSSSRDEHNQSDQEVLNGNSVTMVIPNMQSDPVHNSGEHGGKMVDSDYEEEEEDEVGQICADSGELIDGQYSAKEMPESLGVMGENIEEQSQENSDHGESIKAAGFKTEDDEDDTYQDADDVEDMDDEDDFARKVGLMFS